MKEASNRTMLEIGTIDTTRFRSDNLLYRADSLIYSYEKQKTGILKQFHYVLTV